MFRIAIIIGSTRPGRKGEAVAKWVYEIAQKRSDAAFELVDIKDFNLPLLDEPRPSWDNTTSHTPRRGPPRSALLTGMSSSPRSIIMASPAR
jgi:NAD(P)H-dependent FMN reductase